MPDPHEKSIPGMVLAAGLSRRMGECKLLLPFQGRPLLSHCLEAALGGPKQSLRRLEPLVLVRGPHSPCFGEALRLLPEGCAPEIFLITAKHAAQGQAASLKAGLAEILKLAPACPGVMVLLGDQPLVGPELVRRLVDCFLALCRAGEEACVAPAYQGKRGNPVILHRKLFPEIMELNGDFGARSLLAMHEVHLLSCADAACLADIDDPDDYTRLSGAKHGPL